MIYGSEVMGMSNSMAQEATRVAAAALTPPTRGKNPVLVMHAASIHSVAVNPNVAINVGAIKAWSTAWWEGWAKTDDMIRVYKHVKIGIDKAQPNHWGIVKGPSGAVAATCLRLQWRSDDGRHFRDDIGAHLDAKLDPPEAFANAARRSVERLSLDAVIEQLPAAAPAVADVSAYSTFGAENERDGGRRSIMVNLSSCLRPLFRGSAKLQRKLPQWTPACRGYLSSAINGGQWTQGMKAKLPQFTGTSLCQLCLAAEGTLAHRHCCPTSTPAGGWTPLGPHAAKFAEALSEPRARILQTRGVLTVQIPIATPQIPTGGWRWLTPPPDPALENLKWVIDGSRKYASHWSLSTTGCGVAVLDADGALIAYATATPPQWVKTAGAAEAWALLLTLRENLCIPEILTDCLGLLNAAKAGPTAATTARKTDARIWRLVSDVTGDSFKVLAQHLVWMPAHTNAANVRVKSDGKRFSTAEWRANQLADVLAKKGAASTPLRTEVDKAIKDAGNALLQSAARLGVVSHAANNHHVEFVKADGSKGHLTKRDSAAVPPAVAKAKAARDEAKAAAPVAPLLPGPALLKASPLAPTTQLQAKRERKSRAAELRSSEAAAVLCATLAQAAASSRPPTYTATERLAALRARRGLAGGRPLPAVTQPAPNPAEATTWKFLDSCS